MGVGLCGVPPEAKVMPLTPHPGVDECAHMEGGTYTPDDYFSVAHMHIHVPDVGVGPRVVGRVVDGCLVGLTVVDGG